MESPRTAITARWTLLPSGTVGVRAAEDVTVLVEGNLVTRLLPSGTAPAGFAHLELPSSVLMPGFVNLHNHALNGPIFRGIVDDVGTAATVSADNLVYSLLLPVGNLAAEVLDSGELAAVYRLAVLELLRSGTTSVLDMARASHRGLLDAALELGLRTFAAPYVFSTPANAVDADGRPVYEVGDEEASLAAALALADEYDGGCDGLVRVGLGPHATDTCSPTLLRRIAALVEERDSFASIHVAQSRGEVEEVRARHGCTPVEYLDRVGLLGPRLVLAHGVYLDDTDLGRVRDAGATLAHCPLTFARSGVPVVFDRFHRAGVRTGIGTDAYSFDHFGELRAAGILSKLDTRDGARADAATLLTAATATGGAALDPRLGRIAPGALADLVAVDLAGPHVQPVRNPLRNLVWNAHPADVRLVMIDGRVVVRDFQCPDVDETRVVAEASDAVALLWQAAEKAGILPPIERNAG